MPLFVVYCDLNQVNQSKQITEINTSVGTLHIPSLIPNTSQTPPGRSDLEGRVSQLEMEKKKIEEEKNELNAKNKKRN